MLLLTILAISHCLATKSHLRIYGGEDAKPGEYPYVVRIENQRIVNYTINDTIVARHTHICSGAALSPVWVISAAHCASHPVQSRGFQPNTVQKLVIRYGHVEHSPWVKDTFSDVHETIPHPLYTPISKYQNHDLLLIKTSPMNITRFLKVSAINYKSLNGQEAILSGFGDTTETIDGKYRIKTTLDLKKPLQVVTVMISKCPLHKTEVPSLCAVSICDKVIVACSGDSGGPLIHPSGLIGVTSMGPETGYCGDRTTKTRPLYVNSNVAVSPYIEWILSHVQARK